MQLDNVFHFPRASKKLNISRQKIRTILRNNLLKKAYKTKIILRLTEHHIHRASHSQSITFTEHHIHRASHSRSITFTEHHIHRASHSQSITFTEHHIHRASHSQSITFTEHHIHRDSFTLCYKPPRKKTIYNSKVCVCVCPDFIRKRLMVMT